jgi:D-inositol-3-phosphate glycosyltransferase
VTDGVTGLLVDGHDPRDWAGVLGGLLDEPLRGRRMGAAAALGARRFGWDATVDALLDVYAGALAERFPRSPALRPDPVPLPVGNLAVAP